MRRAPVLLPVSLALVVGGFAAALLGGAGAWLLPEDAAPVAALPSGAKEGERFVSLWCPFLLAPDPLRPLEVCNVRASAATGPASEIDIAMDPHDGEHLVVVAKAYNVTRTLNGKDGEPDPSLYRDVITNHMTTSDGGRSWTEGYLQAFEKHLELPLGWGLGRSEEQGSDPVVEFAPDGNPLVVTLRVSQYPNSDGLPVWRSLDGGATFARLADAYPLSAPDKQWVVTDHARGIVYVATSDFGTGHTGIWITKSLDSGATWSDPVKVCSCFHPGLDVGPDGEVYVSGFGSGGVVFMRSTDQGQTWSAPRKVADLAGGASASSKLFRTPNIPMLASSRVDGGVYVAYATVPADAPAPCRLAAALCDDVFLVISRDRGATWGAPVRINDDLTPFAEQFMPVVAVSPNGRDVHVAWMDQRHDASGLTMTTHYRHSPDGGLTWDPNFRISEVASPVVVSFHQNPVPVVTNGWFVGDYIGLVANDAWAVVAFPDTRYGRADVFVATVL